jgi:hypothetical protein
MVSPVILCVPRVEKPLTSLSDAAETAVSHNDNQAAGLPLRLST